VEPGDIVRADVDGVVVCPIGLAEEVIETAIKGRQVDEKCRQDLEAGHAIKETFAKWRGK
jgi:regulator of RNase E activity RraA